MSNALRGTVLPNFRGGDVACRHSSTFWTSFIQSARSISRQILHHQQALSEELGRKLRLTLSSARERLYQQAGQIPKHFQWMSCPVAFGAPAVEHTKMTLARLLISVRFMALAFPLIKVRLLSTFAQSTLPLASGTEYRNLAVGGVANV